MKSRCSGVALTKGRPEIFRQEILKSILKFADCAPLGLSDWGCEMTAKNFAAVNNYLDIYRLDMDSDTN